jgi:glucarate dehydratase
VRITRIRATPINIPLEAPMWWTGGLYPGTSKAIVEVETDEGPVGLGEAPSPDVCDMIVSIGEALAGRDPLDIVGCERVCVPPWRIVQNTDDARVVKAFGAIEIAPWDLRGKAWGQPLSMLLGGKVRETVAFSEYFGFRERREMTPEAVVDYCLAMRERHGSTIFEGKLIRGDPLLEVETVRRLREALGPSAEIRLDSNMQWSLTAARRVLRMLADYDVSNYEEPVATFEEMAALRQHSDIPFSTHVPDLRRAVTLGVPDFIVTKFAVLGGIGRAIRLIGACEAMGVGFWCYSGDAGICTAADLHVSAATPWITQASQSLFRWRIGDIVEGGPFRQINNVVNVPDSPGLGVALDRDGAPGQASALCRERTLGPFPRSDPPGRHRRIPLR